MNATCAQGLPPKQVDHNTVGKFRCHISKRLLNAYPRLKKMYSIGLENIPGYWECYLAEYKIYINIPKNWTSEL